MKPETNNERHVVDRDFESLISQYEVSQSWSNQIQAHISLWERSSY